MMNLKKIIKEEINLGLDWLNFDYNPWIEHDAIIFDKIPEKEDLKKYLEMALNTKNPDNYSDWDDLDHSKTNGVG